MTTKEFIEKAIEGGWECYLESGTGHGLSDMFLDPKAWQAVGKVYGWNEEYNCPSCGLEYYEVSRPAYSAKMHRMIDALIEGKSIEEYLKTL